MNPGELVPSDIEDVLRRHFDGIFTDGERARILEFARLWEAEHPDETSAERIEAWITIVYVVQAERFLD
jgi:hypothetical protein